MHLDDAWVEETSLKWKFMGDCLLRKSAKTPCSLFVGLSGREMGIKPDLPNPPSLFSSISPSIVQNDDGAPLNIDRLSLSVIEERNRPGFQILNISHGKLTNTLQMWSASIVSFLGARKETFYWDTAEKRGMVPTPKEELHPSLDLVHRRLLLTDPQADGAVMEDLIQQLIMWEPGWSNDDRVITR